ncbi:MULTISPECIES: AraC family transcriptional regulator [unclassified Rathayibacter]|uniref:AraC family transcriptional regulator n=1 Tax=unclassified Rathayibacter TaxID=2609250 RepID=UPI00188C315B|nr:MULTISPECIES: AraC family transcriptional regulator [unclassified Rathayibacter]MBF4461131.1 helix-turn-helix transcriptional regulator [Rathayibacter sp. VKM Ac-2879]MBF4502542.1 helix-turn-helix transcriptional regulator [Rathayibacter sp. VKM Ac-2878]
MTRPLTSPQVDVSIGLSNGAAAEWLAARGYHLPAVSNLRVYGDRVTLSTLTLERFYLTAERMTRTISSGAAVLSIVVDGALGIEQSGTRINLEKGGAVVHSGTPATLVSAAPYGVVEVAIHDGFSERWGIEPPPGLLLIPEGLGTVRILLAMMAAALSSAATVSEAAWPRLQNGVESAVAAVFTEIQTPFTAPASARDRLLQRSRQAIEAQYADPDFGVASLADRVAVSLSVLHDAFSAAGLTPFREIRLARLQAAKRMLAQRHPPTTAIEEEVARQAGFRSRRALREALRSGEH